MKEKPKNKSVPFEGIHVRTTPELLSQIDAEAKRQFRTRTNLVLLILQKYFEQNQGGKTK